MHTASEDGTGYDPERAGQIPKLRGEHRAHQRSWAGNCGKMMAEDYPFVGYKKVAAIFQSLGGSGAQGIDGENLRSNEAAVEAISQGIATGRRYDKPESIDGLAAVDRHYADG